METVKSGIIGVSEAIPSVESFEQSTETNDQELKSCVEIRQIIELPDGEAFFGRAGQEYMSDEEFVSIENESVTVTQETQKSAMYTEFLLLPSGYILPKTKAGTFVFDLISAQYGIDVKRARIDIDEFKDSINDSTTWKIGFKGRESNAENGLIHGLNVEDDRLIGEAIRESDINQIGLEYTYSGHLVKLMLSESGYISIYQPNSYDTAEFLTFLKDEVIPFTEWPE